MLVEVNMLLIILIWLENFQASSVLSIFLFFIVYYYISALSNIK